MVSKLNWTNKFWSSTDQELYKKEMNVRKFPAAPAVGGLFRKVVDKHSCAGGRGVSKVFVQWPNNYF